MLRHPSTSLFGVILLGSLHATGCGGRAESVEPTCNGASCNTATDSGARGFGEAGSGAVTCSLDAGATAIVSRVVTDEASGTSVSDLTGIAFSIAPNPTDLDLVNGTNYFYPPSQATGAYRERDWCSPGYYLHIDTCDVRVPGCLYITLDPENKTSAYFVQPDGMSRGFSGHIDAIKAPLLSDSDPPQYGLTGSFEFSDFGFCGITLKGTFGVRFLGSIANSGPSIC